MHDPNLTATALGCQGALTTKQRLSQLCAADVD
jgi:hypothetical protein